jgi:hypothetical protein
MPLLSGDETCPIPEQLLFQIYQASKGGQPIPLSDMSPEIRSMVALFCYRRSHLEKAGLAIAAMCEEPDHFLAAGNLGAVLFARSRNYRTTPTGPTPPKLVLSAARTPSADTDPLTEGGELEAVAL